MQTIRQYCQPYQPRQPDSDALASSIFNRHPFWCGVSLLRHMMELSYSMAKCDASALTSSAAHGGHDRSVERFSNSSFIFCANRPVSMWSRSSWRDATSLMDTRTR